MYACVCDRGGARDVLSEHSKDAFFLLLFWTIPGSTQGLLLALCSGITLGGAQGTI